MRETRTSGSVGVLGEQSPISTRREYVNQLVRDGTGDPLFPIEFDVPFVVLSALVAILAGTLAGLIPARQSKKLSPIEVIRGG